MTVSTTKGSRGEAQEPQEPSNDVGRPEHPSLHCVDWQATKDRVYLRFHKACVQAHHFGDFIRVLGGKRGERGCPIAPAAAKARRSAWIPAPPLESEPAMLRATGRVFTKFLLVGFSI